MTAVVGGQEDDVDRADGVPDLGRWIGAVVAPVENLTPAVSTRIRQLSQERSVGGHGLGVRKRLDQLAGVVEGFEEIGCVLVGDAGDLDVCEL